MFLPKISIIIPCRNEKNYIAACLHSVIVNDYPENQTEIIVIDGLSNDGTRDIIKSFQIKNKNIQLFDNPDKTVPFALNKGIENSSGDFIIRVDAHCVYSPDYFSKLIEWQQKTQADNIGGIWITRPGDNSNTAKAIAIATSSAFGIGNALYRLKSSEVKEVDTVPFGCYKREVFQKIGLFDEELTRNQDDEFNARLINSGGKIILVPQIEIDYYARKNISQMSKMFYQYGLFKPLVNKKLGKPATIRQFAPPLFVLNIILLPAFCILSKILCILSLFFATSYLILNLAISLKLSILNNSWKLMFILLFVFPSIHFSYGIGYLKGIIKFVLFGQKVNVQKTTLSR
ncbi:MAG: glycosyltransferase family 2 protein [Bacteroidales bacterium]|nr:glycosyltransferase family 2 protein [Bacteroidales bacterium]